MTTPSDVLKIIKEKEIKYVDFRFCDTRGKEQHVTVPAHQVKEGLFTDGKMFDSSVINKQPARFTLTGVIPGWTEGVQLMVEGEKRRFWIPEELAYKGRPGAPSGMLVFDVELLKIIKK